VLVPGTGYAIHGDMFSRRCSRRHAHSTSNWRTHSSKVGRSRTR
jgi:hypothetical protein